MMSVGATAKPQRKHNTQPVDALRRRMHSTAQFVATNKGIAAALVLRL
jgi:hypothetical protein